MPTFKGVGLYSRTDLHILCYDILFTFVFDVVCGINCP